MMVNRDGTEDGLTFSFRFTDATVSIPNQGMLQLSFHCFTLIPSELTTLLDNHKAVLDYTYNFIHVES